MGGGEGGGSPPQLIQKFARLPPTKKSAGHLRSITSRGIISPKIRTKNQNDCHHHDDDDDDGAVVVVTGVGGGGDGGGWWW